MLLGNPEFYEIWLTGVKADELSDIDSDKFRRMCLNRVFDRLAVYARLDELGLSADANSAAEQHAQQLRESAALRACSSFAREGIAACGYAGFVTKIHEVSR